MPIRDDTYAYRRDLPHLTNDGKTYLVTFLTQFRFVMADEMRNIVLGSCTHDHTTLHWLHTATVMPDHVHLVLTPIRTTLSTIVRRIKSASSYLVNRHSARSGALWRRESFDHILRSDEDLHEKCIYVLENPVRAGLVKRWQDYPWNFRSDGW